ncbi:uncharacterized protein LOC110442430 isoform X2 [Mizuhopecten yessoensis]|uniref:uncharacterized protein LOC110442430 isoform X2 n=1 Tax=Mizuhopecten yessoensis TaxID=6573 RepID=UPI000B45D91C|nr:uncharacterized protein LOC110442430 isoform X2 [Mizuhopecten yessoensis]
MSAPMKKAMTQISLPVISPRSSSRSPCTKDSQQCDVSQVFDQRICPSDISYDDFFQKYLLQNKPCIISSELTQDWLSRRHWIDGETGDAVAPVANCGQEKFSSQCKEEMRMSEFLDYWGNYMSKGHPRSQKCLYLKDWHFTKAFPSYQAYSTPVYFLSDWMNEFWDSRTDSHDDYRFVYMGPKGSWTPFHADVFRSFSWSANICGRKRWIFLAPGEEEKYRNKFGNLVYDINSDELNDPKQYPCYSQSAARIEVIQEPGEVIFVPSGWHHQVHNLEDTISINHNWMNGCNIKRCWNFLEQELSDVQREISDCRDMEGWQEQCQLILKASSGIDYSEFYRYLITIATHRMDFLQLEQNSDGIQNLYLKSPEDKRCDQRMKPSSGEVSMAVKGETNGVCQDPDIKVLVATGQYRSQSDRKIDTCQSGRQIDTCRSGRQMDTCQSDRQIDTCQSDRQINTCQSERQIDTCQSDRQIDTCQSDRQIDTCQSDRQIDTCQSDRQIDTCQSDRQIDTCQSDRQIDTCQSDRQIDTCQSDRQIDTCQSDRQIDTCQSDRQIDTCQSDRQIDTCQSDINIDTCQSERHIDTCQSDIHIDTFQSDIHIDTCQSDIHIDTCQSDRQIDTCQSDRQINTCQIDIHIDTCQRERQIDTCQSAIQIDTCQSDIQIDTYQSDVQFDTCQSDRQIDTCQSDSQYLSDKKFCDINSVLVSSCTRPERETESQTGSIYHAIFDLIQVKQILVYMLETEEFKLINTNANVNSVIDRIDHYIL